MAKDIFNRESSVLGGAFAADMVRVTFPGLAGGMAEIGVLLQRLSIVYQQNVQMLYELGNPKGYFVAGRAAGQGQIARVIGPTHISLAFYQKYGDVCKAADNSLQIALRTGCDKLLPPATLTLRHVVLTAVNWDVAAADMIINTNAQLMFLALEYAHS